MVDKKPAGGRRHRDPDATRQALLLAGTELFAERGYDGVSLSVIAERAGVNKAMVSYHFGGKRALYRTIVTATFTDIAASAETLAGSRRPAPDLLRELIALIADTAIRRNPHFPAMMLREVLAGGKRIEAETMAYPLRIAEVVRQIVARGVREGTFRPVNPLLTHVSLVGSLLFFFATTGLRERLFTARRLRGKAPGAAEYVKHVQSLLIDGLAAGRGQGARREGRAAP